MESAAGLRLCTAHVLAEGTRCAYRSVVQLKGASVDFSWPLGGSATTSDMSSPDEDEAETELSSFIQSCSLWPPSLEVLHVPLCVCAVSQQQPVIKGCRSAELLSCWLFSVGLTLTYTLSCDSLIVYQKLYWCVLCMYHCTLGKWQTWVLLSKMSWSGSDNIVLTVLKHHHEGLTGQSGDHRLVRTIWKRKGDKQQNHHPTVRKHPSVYRPPSLTLVHFLVYGIGKDDQFQEVSSRLKQRTGVLSRYLRRGWVDRFFSCEQQLCLWDVFNSTLRVWRQTTENQAQTELLVILALRRCKLSITVRQMTQCLLLTAPICTCLLC